jgi:antibiotic biosynthesis monooxygenase (ABM) superfamily enzyme
VAAIEQPDEPAAEERAGQRVARTDPVTAVFSRRVRPGHEAEFEGWPLPLRAALFPLVLLTMMTYVVMPVVTRLLRRLLRRTPEAW